MSKGSLFWGKGSGKLGETVLYRSGGEQRTRTYVAKIKNPKTLSQMKNRLSMLNFATIYRALKPILSQSFPNRPSVESGFNAFVRANKSIRSAVIDRMIANSGLCVPYDMLMSEGYLTQFGECGKLSVGAEGAIGFNLVSHPNYSAIAALWEEYAGSGIINTSAKLEKLWGALQLPADAKITIIWADYADEGYRVSSFQITREMSDTDLSALPHKLTMVGSDNLGEPVTPVLTVGESFSSETMYTIIISWVDGNGKLQVTNSRMGVPTADESFAAQFVEGGDVYNQVLDGYGYTENSAL